MNTIFKYVLDATDDQILKIPMSARILSVESQKDSIVLYAMIDSEEIVKRGVFIKIRGTGHNCDKVDADDYFTTVKMYEDGLVFHVFIRG